ncbi:MAG: hypothetical protein Q7R95_09260 [bacterium]|nr:hypothetical protein [bacterium]
MIHFQISVVDGNSKNCFHTTNYELKNLNTPFTKSTIETLKKLGLLGYGQNLFYTIESQKREDSGDGMNFYYVLDARRECDSSD